MQPASSSHDTKRHAGPWAGRLQRAWRGRGALACALWPLSRLYGLLVGLRRWLYLAGLLRSTHPGLPVVVVGNLVAGGAGKTPAVIAIVQHLQARGWRPGVISRGYGRRTPGCLEVGLRASALDCGDEPLLIRQRTQVPVFVAEQRIDAALALRRAHPDTDIVVADDGLQHHALARDINIAVFDERGLGNGWLLPAGPLREPWQAGRPGLDGRIHAAIDLVLHSGAPAAIGGHRCSRALADHAVDGAGRPIALQTLRGRPLLAIAGIARPERFFQMLREQGLELAQTQAWPDHDDLSGFALPDDPSLVVLCTEKDAVKLFPRHPQAGQRLLAVPLVWHAPAEFFAELDRLLARLRPAGHPLPSPHGHTTS